MARLTAKQVRNEFPENKSYRARTEAIIEGFVACRSVLQNLKSFIELIPEKSRPIIERQIDGALEKAEIASQALAGDETNE